MHIKTLFTALCCAMLLTPAVSFGADDAAKTKPASKETVADTPFVIVAPSEEIIVSFPLFEVERGVVDSIDAMRSMIRSSIDDRRRYEPQQDEVWSAAYEKFLSLYREM